MLETIIFWQSISIFQYFQFFSIVIYDEILSIFQNLRFDKERKKNTHAGVNEKRKTEKKWTLFYNRLFYEAL